MVITHVVTFKLTNPAEDTVRLKVLIEGLPAGIPEIRSLVVGSNVVDSPRAHDLVLISTFDDRDALEAYQRHPHHQPVLDFAREHCSSITSVDFAS